MTVIATVQRWDEWFEATADEESLKTWAAAKQVYPEDEVSLDKWAYIIEMNRLGRLEKKEAPEGTSPSGA